MHGAGNQNQTRLGPALRNGSFPAGEHEDLVEIWLWSARVGIFSHETALALQDLSDALPARTHLTLPDACKRRRIRVPKGVVLHVADVAKEDRAWVGAAPVTTPRRTVADCIEASVQPDLIRQALEQASNRGNISRDEAKALRRQLDRRKRARP